MEDHVPRPEDPGGPKRSNLASSTDPLFPRLSDNYLRRTMSNPSLISEEDRQRTKQFAKALSLLPDGRQASPSDRVDPNGSDDSRESMSNPHASGVRFAQAESGIMGSVVKNSLNFPSHHLHDTPNNESLLPLSTSTPLANLGARRPLRPDASMSHNRSNLHFPSDYRQRTDNGLGTFRCQPR